MIVKIPIRVLMKYREFDRIKKPAPNLGFLHSNTVYEVKEWLEKGNECSPIELSINYNTALLTDGNHRIAAQNLLHGLNYLIDVEIKNVSGKINEIFYDHTIKRFKKINNKLSKYIKRELV